LDNRTLLAKAENLILFARIKPHNSNNRGIAGHICSKTVNARLFCSVTPEKVEEFLLDGGVERA
jgi:hypothetical protein